MTTLRDTGFPALYPGLVLGYIDGKAVTYRPATADHGVTA